MKREYSWPKDTNGTPMPTPCREFQGYRNERGYGVITRNGRSVRVHRFIWEAAHGPIPSGMIVMHLCDVRACFRLDHLMVGTVADNQRDMATKGRSPKAAAVLTASEVRRIRERVRSGEMTKRVALEFGVSPSTITDLMKGRTWRDVA